MSARHVAAVAALSLVGGALFIAYTSNLLNADHNGTGAEGGDEEEDPGALSSITNRLGNLVSGNPDTMSDAGLAALQAYEGFSATAYVDDKAGTPEVEYSIGFGHQIRQGEEALLSATLDQSQGVEILAGDVAWAERAVSAAVSAPLTQAQFDALVSLCYNIGESAFRKSTLVRLLNALDYAGAAAQFDRWNKTGGAVSTALTRRRASERAMFEGGITV